MATPRSVAAATSIESVPTPTRAMICSAGLSLQHLGRERVSTDDRSRGVGAQREQLGGRALAALGGDAHDAAGCRQGTAELGVFGVVVRKGDEDDGRLSGGGRTAAHALIRAPGSRTCQGGSIGLARVELDSEPADRSHRRSPRRLRSGHGGEERLTMDRQQRTIAACHDRRRAWHVGEQGDLAEAAPRSTVRTICPPTVTSKAPSATA